MPDGHWLDCVRHSLTYEPSCLFLHRLCWFLALGTLISLTFFVFGSRPLAVDQAVIDFVQRMGELPDRLRSGVADGSRGILARGDLLDAFMYLVSVPGDGVAITLFGVLAVVIALHWAGQRRAALTLLVIDLVASSVNMFVYKPLVGRLRPTAENATILALWNQAGLHRYSFPSGHTVHYTVLFGFLAWWGWTTLPRGPVRNALLASAGTMLVLVGVSRVYLGAHWPSDVFAGYLAGYLWLGVGVALMRDRRWLPRIEPPEPA